MSGTVLSYPIPAYQNLPINSDYYSPSEFVISAISQGVLTTVTMATNTNFVIGQLVRFIIPPSFGIRGLNGQSGYVVSIPSANQVTVNINSNGMDAYILSSATTVAQILPIGDINQGAINTSGPMSTETFIPGSFINIG